MNLKKFLETQIILEAPMNTAAYEESLKTASTIGMKMGFEAEVLLPKGIKPIAIKKKSNEQKVKALIKKRTIKWKEWLKNDGELLNMFDFTYQVSLRTPALKGFTPAKKKKFISDMKNFAIEKFRREIWNDIPAKVRTLLWKEFVAHMNPRYASKTKSHFLSMIDDMTEGHWSWEDAVLAWDGNDDGTMTAPAVAKETYAKICKLEQVNTIEFIEEKYKDLQSFMTAYGVSINPDYKPSNSLDDRDWMGQGSARSPDKDYGYAATVLEPLLKGLFKKVRVHVQYHEKVKDLKYWYIEPDGSLEPDKAGEGQAEIVSPPEPVLTSIQHMEQLFAELKKINAYTNDSTGLHINLSIPEQKNLDLLKLAVFLGDPYVLKTFHRENNGYCGSVYARLDKSTDYYRQSSDESTFKNALNSLMRSVRAYASNHSVSISYESEKYISFRHIGGNYLGNYETVMNTVKRFIRAFVIASDPRAYFKDYVKKVAQLMIPKDTPSFTSLRPREMLMVWIYDQRHSLKKEQFEPNQHPHDELRGVPDSEVKNLFSRCVASYERLFTELMVNDGYKIIVPNNNKIMNYIIKNIPDDEKIIKTKVNKLDYFQSWVLIPTKISLKKLLDYLKQADVTNGGESYYYMYASIGLDDNVGDKNNPFNTDMIKLYLSELKRIKKDKKK
jgi:hypothetical protein